MALGPKEALKKASATIENSDPVRARYETLCGLWQCYAYGPQWARETRGSSLSGNRLSYLKSVIAPKRQDVRIAMNMIQGRIERTNARLMPRELDYVAKPASRASNDMVAAMVATSRLKQQTEDVGSIRALRRASLWRCVLGSSVIKRTMMRVGPSVVVRGADGQPSMGPTGRPRTISTFRNQWTAHPPYEFIRDPSATTTDFNDEQIIGHECPRTTEWLSRTYGITVETKSVMGDLLEFQRWLLQASGQSFGQSFGNSKLPAVMVSEWWFKDPDREDPDRPWPWRMMAFRDTRAKEAGDRKLRVLEFGENPYHGLPLHHIVYDHQTGAPWGIGIPPKCIPAQDSYNIAHTNMLRVLVAHGTPKYVVEANSLVDGIKDGLNTRADLPIVYHQGRKPPERMATPQIDSTVRQILADSPDWFDSMLNHSPVQIGQAVKRGESKSAYEFRKDSADMSQTAILDEDELTLNELLTGTIHDIIKTESTKAMVNRLSHEYTVSQILTLKQQDSIETLAGVKIVKETLRPRTSLEVKEDFVAAITSQIVDPVVARRSMLVQNGIAFDVQEQRSYEQQVLEIASLLNGEEAGVYLGQNHEMHQFTLELEMNSPRFSAYSSDQQAAIQQHWTEHQEMKQIQLQLQQPLAPLPDESGMSDSRGDEGDGALMEQPTNTPAGAAPTPTGGPGGSMGLGLGEGVASGIGLPQTGVAATAPMPSVPVGAGLM